MEQPQVDLIDINSSIDVRKRKLLPWWIKVFIWIFIFFGLIVPIGLVLAMLGYAFPIAIYGIQTDEPISLIGIALLLIFALKATVAYGLWFEKKWAVTLGIFDAILGMLICLFAMLVPLFLPSSNNVTFQFRFEFILLIPYLITLFNLRPKWVN